MPEPASAVATLLAARDPEEREAALAALAAGGARELALLEAALPDLARDVPGALAVAARLAAQGARRGDAAAARLLDVLARAGSPDEARLLALAALRAPDASARGAFALALEAVAQGLAPSPLRDKLVRVAQAESLSPEVAARAFAASYEAARAAGDAQLLQLSRDTLAPTLEEHGLSAVFDRALDVGAFDVRPGTSATASASELGRPAVRSRAGVVVVRGVVFVAPTDAPPSGSASGTDHGEADTGELVAAVRRALEPGSSASTLEAARRALDAIDARLRARGAALVN